MRCFRGLESGTRMRPSGGEDAGKYLDGTVASRDCRGSGCPKRWTLLVDNVDDDTLDDCST